MNKIAIITPFKEDYSEKSAGAVSLWVKDYLLLSDTNKFTIVFGNLKKKTKSYSSNFVNIQVKSNLNKNLNYIKNIKKIILNSGDYSTIEIHNRPQYLSFFKELKKIIKIIVFHNNPLKLKGSKYAHQRLNILQNADHIIFVSEWCKSKFFEDLDKKDSSKCKVIYPAINVPENKISKKEKIIIFTGKLNAAKGYDVFGNAITDILEKNPNWKAIVVGNERRERHYFKHPNLKIFDWMPHRKILNLYKKASISVVCSRWDEPFGRAAMESSNYGCLTIISNKGGLVETSFNPIILEELTVENLKKKINFYIKNKNILKKKQINNFNNKKILLTNESKKLDLIKNFKPFLYNYIRNKPLRILHISNFDEKNNLRLFNISISIKLSNGFIKNNHNVVNFCYRNFHNKNKFSFLNDKLDKKILEINDNYRPDLILFGHFNNLKRETIDQLKNKYKTKVFMWYEDALSNIAKGPNWKSNLDYIEKNNDLIDKYFVTTHPDVIKTKIDRKKLNFLPVPADTSVEFLELYNSKYKLNDLFFAFSHGVNFGKLRKNIKDKRIIFLDKIKIKLKDRFLILGKDYSAPKWNFDYYDELAKSKTALNLSRGLPVKYTSSNRISSLIANGIYTFIDEKTKFYDFFNEDEVGFYKNENDLLNKLDKILSNEKNLKKFSENGKKKYFKLFDNKIIAKNIISDFS